MLLTHPLLLFFFPPFSQEVKPFLQQVRTGGGDLTANTLVDKVLVGAGSVPCTMQFRFENHYATLLEKVSVTYRIQVTPPSPQMVMQGRRRRVLAALKALDSDLTTTQESMITILAQRAELEKETVGLQNQYNTLLEQWQTMSNQKQEY
jgi:hypothetical protein